MPSLSLSPDQLLELRAGTDSFETGRQIILFDSEATSDHIDEALGGFGPMARASDFKDGDFRFEQAGDATSVVFDELGMALVTGDEPAMFAASDRILAVVPEIFMFPSEQVQSATLAPTWGLTKTDVLRSPYSGQGIKVAVLDTGLDLNHPDFAGRTIVSQSFIPGQTAQDGAGHGTHCIGTACGPQAPLGVGRYGIAYGADIYAGKVLSNSGTGTAGTVLNGMNWAIANRCQVISMSLGADAPEYPPYTQAGQRALDAGCLIIAAASNASRRPGYIAPTGSPANSPTIVAVAAVNPDLTVAYFSCGGKIEIAGPGSDVFSTLPMPRRYGTLSGTSMATPHVAGIAALLAEANPAHRGAALRNALLAKALPLPLPATDVGAGLVRA